MLHHFFRPTRTTKIVLPATITTIEIAKNRIKTKMPIAQKIFVMIGFINFFTNF